MIETNEDGSLRLLPATLAQLGIQPRGVIHVGAHHGEEVPLYVGCGFTEIVLVEPDPANCDTIRDQVNLCAADIDLVWAACTRDGTGSVVLHRSSRSLGTGLFSDGQTVEQVEVPATSLRALQAERDCNVVVIDTQGTELDVLMGADLAPLDLVVIETRNDDSDAPAAHRGDTIAYMAGHGWQPVIQWRHGYHPYADTLFIRAGS